MEKISILISFVTDFGWGNSNRDQLIRILYLADIIHLSLHGERLFDWEWYFCYNRTHSLELISFLNQIEKGKNPYLFVYVTEARFGGKDYNFHSRIKEKELKAYSKLAEYADAYASLNLASCYVNEFTHRFKLTPSSKQLTKHNLFLKSVRVSEQLPITRYDMLVHSLAIGFCKFPKHGYVNNYFNLF